MHSKRPVQRAIDVQIELCKGVELRGTAYRNDYGDGATTHTLDGRLTGADGTTYRFLGTLRGVRFEKIETRGATKKTGRNLALYFAFRLFQAGGMSKPNARKEVQEMWDKKGWKGVAQDTQRDDLIRKGEKAAKGLRVFAFVFEDSGGAVFALPHAANQTATNVSIDLKGNGWIWFLGMECAEYGHIEYSAPVETDGEGVGFLPVAMPVNFEPEKVVRSQDVKKRVFIASVP